MANTDIPFLSTLGKPETQSFGGSVIGHFSIRLILKKWLTLIFCTRKSKDKKFCQFSFPNFSIGSVFPITHPRFCFNMDAWLCLKHFCVVTFLHSDNGRQIFCQFSFPNFFVGSVLPVTHPSLHFNMDAWLHLKYFCMVSFLHLENGRHKFSIDSVFQTFLLVQFSPSPILGLFHHLCMVTHKTFIHGHLCMHPAESSENTAICGKIRKYIVIECIWQKLS